MVGLVLAIPVISGVGGTSPAVELDSSSTTAAAREGNSPVVMGMDGRPVSSADFAGVTTSGTSPSPEPEGTAVASGPAAAVEAPASESVEAPSAETTEAAPAETPSTGGTTGTPAGSPSTAPGTRPPTSSQPAPAPAPPPAAPVEAPAEVSDAAAEALALVNAERASLGCGALVADAGLAAAAQAHSAAMSASGVLGLDGLVGAVAQGPNAHSVVAGWLADTAASEALLDCSRTSAGIAVVDGWWTALPA